MVIRELLETARDRGDAPFLHVGDRTVSWSEYVGIVESAAATWQRIGIEPGDAVAVMMPNSLEYLSALHGLAWIGAVSVPLNNAYRPADAAYALTEADVVAVLTDGAHLGSAIGPVVGEIATIRRVVLVEDGEADGFRRPPAAGTEVPRPELDDEDRAAILFTSGTSGRPKGVLVPQAQVVVNGRALADAIDLRPGDTHYSVFPLFHVNAQTIVSAALITGAQVVLGTRFSLSEFWPTVRDKHITHVSYLGSVIPLLDKLHDPRESGTDLRVLWGAGAAGETQERLERRWGVVFLEVYGMTEVGIVLASPTSGLRRRGTCGAEIAGHEVRVVDDTGAPVPDGVPGEIVVRVRPGMLHGYLNDPGGTAAAIRQGWMHTGDIASRDADGFFTFLDRSKDIIRRSGENISSADVEAVVREHPAVVDAAAVPSPDPVREEEVRIVVVLTDGLTCDDVPPAELVDWCRRSMAVYKLPRYVEYATDLPRTPTGKIRKVVLRAAFGAAPVFDTATGRWHPAEPVPGPGRSGAEPTAR